MAQTDRERNSREDGNRDHGSTDASLARRDTGSIPVVGEDFEIIEPSEADTAPIDIEPEKVKPRVRLRFSEPDLNDKAEIAFQWAASFCPTGRAEAATHRQRAVTVGSAARYVNRTFLLDAIADKCRDIVARRETTIICASLPDVDVVLGWICFDARALHYVYVTESARHTGIATQLMEKASAIGSIPCSCMTASGAGFLSQISKKWWLPQ